MYWKLGSEFGHVCTEKWIIIPILNKDDKIAANYKWVLLLGLSYLKK